MVENSTLFTPISPRIHCIQVNLKQSSSAKRKSQCSYRAPRCIVDLNMYESRIEYAKMYTVRMYYHSCEVTFGYQILIICIIAYMDPSLVHLGSYMLVYITIHSI